ncbi:putative RelA/SpoT domain-containing protein [uncultured Gammaproteobacteria bacterium]
MLMDDELKLSCVAVEGMARAAQKACLSTLESIKGGADVYNFKERVKPQYNIFWKVVRKRREAPHGHKNKEYDPIHLTDAWGCRYVTLFQSGIVELVRKLLCLIKHEEVDGIKTSPFEKGGLEEVIVYSNRQPNDPLSIAGEVRSLLTDSGLLDNLSDEKKKLFAQPEYMKSGYSSVHFIVRVPIQCSEFTDFNNKDKILGYVKIEIQLRDIFEEAWGEIQHSLVYAGKDQSPQERLDASEASWRPHLNALKLYVDGCSQHATIIKQNARSPKPISSPKVDSTSLSPLENDLQNILSALNKETPSTTIEAIKKAYDLLIVEQNKKTIPGSPEFRDVAEAFKDAIERSRVFLAIRTVKGRSVGYNLYMEYAFALFNTVEEGVAQGFEPISQQIIPIFETIESDFPDDVVALFRHSRALIRLAKVIEDFRCIHQLLSRAEAALGRDRTIEPGSWLRLAVPNVLGYVQWSIFILLRKDPVQREKAMEYLGGAITFTRQALSYVKKMESNEEMCRNSEFFIISRNAISNLLYYNYENQVLLHGSKESARFNGPTWDKVEIDNLISALEGYRATTLEKSDLSTRDTLMCVHYILRHDQEARELATMNMNEIMELAQGRAGHKNVMPSDVTKHLKTPAEIRCYKKALDIWSVLDETEG